MLAIFGIIFVFAMVFGGFTLAGGKFDIILHALPFEGMMIGGAAIGAFMISNGIDVIKKSLKGTGSVIKGPNWKSQDYRDLLCLMFELTRVMKMKGAIGMEPHVEQPGESPIFQRYPRIVADHFSLDLICDSFRMINMDVSNPHQVEEIIEKKIRKHHGEALAPSKALQSMADGLPALGIVAAVLGVIKTMASIDQPPTILGNMIGGALVGTFLGVFLAYCIVGPFASRLKQMTDEEGAFYMVVRDVITSYLHGYAPQVAVEIGRGNIPTKMQPTFYEVEQSMKGVPPLA